MKKNSPLRLLFSLIMVVFLIAIIHSLFSSDDSPAKMPTKNEAFITAKDFVKQELKSPSTAEFNDGFYYVQNPDSSFIISGKVDSQNSFGAMVRSDYKVILKWKGGDWSDDNNWTLNSINVQ